MVAWWSLGLPRLVFLPEPAPIHPRIEAPEQFNRDTRPLVLDQAHWSANSLGMLWQRDELWMAARYRAMTRCPNGRIRGAGSDAGA